MSDARNQAIQKAATELVLELIAATKAPGGEKWVDIIAKKMERLPSEGGPKAKPRGLTLRLPDSAFSFDWYTTGVVVSKEWWKGKQQRQEIGAIRHRELAILQSWLNSKS